MIKKMLDEQPLTVEEALRLDEALENQTVVSRLMGQLEDGAPSLAWRSALNEKMVAYTGRRKREWTFRWVSGFAATAAITLVAFFAVPRSQPDPIVFSPIHTMPNSKGPGVEESLLTAHLEADIESGLGVSGESVSGVTPGS